MRRNTAGGMLGSLTSRQGVTHVQSCPLRTLRKDHLEWLRHARRRRDGERSAGPAVHLPLIGRRHPPQVPTRCLLYTSDAADDLLCVDLGGRRIIKKKK